MNYISREKFLAQPMEVQKMYWKIACRVCLEEI